MAILDRDLFPGGIRCIVDLHDLVAFTWMPALAAAPSGAT